jgi:hypothetical protein
VKPDQVVAVLLFTLAGSAHGSDWQRVAEFRDQGATFLLDAESVVAVGQNRKAWVEVDFTTEQSVPGSPLKICLLRQCYARCSFSCVDI